QYLRSHLSASLIIRLQRVVISEHRRSLQLRSRVHERLKMCRTVWMWLLILAVLPLSSESEDECLIISCCTKSSNAKMTNIKACYEQKPRTDCHLHTFVIVTQDNKQYCVKPKAQWLKRLINEVRMIS
ncbi:Hypothetical predicted protein, partial [Scomber scombrus]